MAIKQYVFDLDYTSGYYVELNPVRMQFALMVAGIDPPACQTACELGFGKGVSICMHAAASSTSWFGTDFNVSHVTFARTLASYLARPPVLSQEAFEYFAHNKDLPDEFDFIALHGIWSWVSEEDRSALVNFIDKKLKPGGVLYISYNVSPGWGVMSSIRHFLLKSTQIAQNSGGGLSSQIDRAFDLTIEALMQSPSFSVQHPTTLERLKTLKGLDKEYLAHEFFNRHWMPMHFSELQSLFYKSQIHFGCSACLTDSINHIHLSPDQSNFLGTIGDISLREDFRDLMTCQQFRRDYWVKGAQRLMPSERNRRLADMKIVLIRSVDKVPFTVRGALGNADLNKTVYGPAIEALSCGEVISVGELQQFLPKTELAFEQAIQVVSVLLTQGSIELVTPELTSGNRKNGSSDLNRFLVSKAQHGEFVNYLSSPVTAGGHELSRIEQLFLSAHQAGRNVSGDLAQYVWDLLESQGQRLVRRGVSIETSEETLGELNAQATEFQEKRLPILKALGIAS